MTTKQNLSTAAKSFAAGALAVVLILGALDYFNLMRIYYYRVKVPGGSIGIRI